MGVRVWENELGENPVLQGTSVWMPIRQHYFADGKAAAFHLLARLEAAGHVDPWSAANDAFGVVFKAHEAIAIIDG